MQESAREIEIQQMLQPIYAEEKGDEIEVFFLNRNRTRSCVDDRTTLKMAPNPETLDVDTQLQNFGY